MRGTRPTFFTKYGVIGGSNSASPSKLPFASNAFNEHATSEVLCVWITDPAGR